MDESGQVPAQCAAIIEIANGMILFGQADAGRAMLEDLLRTAERRGCGDNPKCAQLVRQAHQALARAREFELQPEPA